MMRMKLFNTRISWDKSIEIYLLSSSQPDSNEANTALPMLKSVSNSNVNAPNTDMTKKEALLLPVFL
jgi:hypothetical protein